jgi:hypothetical protein
MLAAAALGVATLLRSRFWPFEQKPVIQNLQEASDSQVQVRAFHRTYFPYPGCILEGVVFVHGTNATKPLIIIEKLTIRSTYLGILAHHVSLINAEDMKVFIPAFGSGQPLHTQRFASAEQATSTLRCSRGVAA